MAASLSTNGIKLYGLATGQFLGDCIGHTDTISDVSFSDADSPHMLCSSSADGTVRAWDTRLRKEVTNRIPHFYELNYLGWFIYLFI